MKGDDSLHNRGARSAACQPQPAASRALGRAWHGGRARAAGALWLAAGVGEPRGDWAVGLSGARAREVWRGRLEAAGSQGAERGRERQGRGRERGRGRGAGGGPSRSPPPAPPRLRPAPLRPRAAQGKTRRLHPHPRRRRAQRAGERRRWPEGGRRSARPAMATTSTTGSTLLEPLSNAVQLPIDQVPEAPCWHRALAAPSPAVCHPRGRQDPGAGWSGGQPWREAAILRSLSACRLEPAGPSRRAHPAPIPACARVARVAPGTDVRACMPGPAPATAAPRPGSSCIGRSANRTCEAASSPCAHGCRQYRHAVFRGSQGVRVLRAWQRMPTGKQAACAQVERAGYGAWRGGAPPRGQRPAPWDSFRWSVVQLQRGRQGLGRRSKSEVKPGFLAEKVTTLLIEEATLPPLSHPSEKHLIVYREYGHLNGASWVCMKGLRIVWKIKGILMGKAAPFLFRKESLEVFCKSDISGSCWWGLGIDNRSSPKLQVINWKFYLRVFQVYLIYKCLHFTRDPGSLSSWKCCCHSMSSGISFIIQGSSVSRPLSHSSRIGNVSCA